MGALSKNFVDKIRSKFVDFKSKMINLRILCSKPLPTSTYITIKMILNQDRKFQIQWWIIMTSVINSIRILHTSRVNIFWPHHPIFLYIPLSHSTLKSYYKLRGAVFVWLREINTRRSFHINASSLRSSSQSTQWCTAMVLLTLPPLVFTIQTTRAM